MTAVQHAAENYPFGAVEDLSIHPRCAALRREAPVSRVSLPYGGEGWLVVGHEQIRFVLSDRRFSRAALLGADAPRTTPRIVTDPTILHLDPPDHTRLRRLVAGAFAPRRTAALRPEVEDVARDLVDQMRAEGPPSDLVRGLARPLPSMVMSELLGVPFADRDQFFAWSAQVVAGPDADPASIREAFAGLRRYLSERIAERRRHPTDDLLSALVSARDEHDRLSEQELVVFGVTLLLAGLETTTNQLGNFAYHLLAEPHRWEWLAADRSRIPVAVEELLRYTPIAATAGFTRVATEDVVVGDVTVRAGEALLLDLDAANRDEAVFDHAEELRLDRAENPHLAFGHGAHFCLGASLARMELEVGLAALLEGLPGLRLATTTDRLSWYRNRVVRGIEELPVTW